MGAAHQGPAAGELFHQRAPRRDGGRFAGQLRHLLRHDRRPGVLLARRWKQLAADRPRLARSAVRRSADAVMIRVVIPYHLRILAKITGEIQLDVEPPVTLRSVLDALEARYPMLRGTVRDHGTFKRRDFIRFYACEQDLSHDSPDILLPEAIAKGTEPFLIIGAIAGG